jgi:putative transposase
LTPKLKHFDGLGSVRFITFSTYRREPILLDERLCRILLLQIQSARRKYRFQLLAYVIMPEHVHLLIHPPDDVKIGRVVGEIKSLTAREYFAAARKSSSGVTRILWQKRCYDHNCRNERAIQEKIDYCHNNPVNRRLVTSAGDWNWSSYRAFYWMEMEPPEIDVVDL